MSKTLFYSLKHGPVAFHKSDQDHSGSLNLQELPSLLSKVKWWKLSRKTPEEWFKSSDQDKNGVLSQEELAVLLGSEAHIDVFFKRADKNTSGGLDLTEVSLFINELIFPSRRKRGRE
jgi:Ca2+-binding EF-hand superfamily protein